MRLLDGTFTSSGQSAVLALSEVFGHDGIHTLYGKGTWDGGSMKVQVSPDGTNWFDLAGASLSGDGLFNFSSKGYQLRLDFSGGSSSEDVDYWLL